MSLIGKVVEIAFVDEVAQRMSDIEGISTICLIESLFISDLPGDSEVYATIRFAEMVDDDHTSAEFVGNGNPVKKLVFYDPIHIPRKYILMVREARELWKLKREGLDDPTDEGDSRVEPRIFPS